MLGDHDSAVAGGSTDNVSRQPSLRQQEKAPEGREPHIAHEEEEDDEHVAVAGADADVDSPEQHHQEVDHEEDAGPAPVESRFTEGL